MLLQAAVVAVIVVLTGARRGAEPLIVPQALEPILEALFVRQRTEVLLRQAVLRRDPSPGLLALGVLEPAVGVRDRDAMVYVDDVTGWARRISKRLARWGMRAGGERVQGERSNRRPNTG